MQGSVKLINNTLIVVYLTKTRIHETRSWFSKVWISTDFEVCGLVSTQVWKSTTCFSEEWRISLIATYTVLGTIKKWQWHGFLHGNLSSLIRIGHKNFERRFFFNGWDIVTRAWGREIASKSVSLTPKAWYITCMLRKSTTMTCSMSP